MGSRELSEWIAYSEIEPFGEERADLRAGIIASTVANTGYARPSEPARPSDFMPTFAANDEAAEPEMTEAENADLVRKRFELLRLMTGGKHIRRSTGEALN